MEYMQVQHDGLGTVLTFKGRLDHTAYAELRAPIKVELDRQPVHLSCNLREVSYISSAGIRLFFEVAKDLQRRKGSFRIVECTPEVYKVFSLTGMVGLVEPTA